MKPPALLLFLFNHNKLDGIHNNYCINNQSISNCYRDVFFKLFIQVLKRIE